MSEYKTPGVYIVEKSAFPNSVVEAPTAIPAFIGYTQYAVNGNDNLTNVPWKISSMTEFVHYFGEGPDWKFEVDVKAGSLCIEGKNSYTLYYNMMLFFANGGGACYVVSVGSYEDTLKKDSLIAALDKLMLEQEITMVVVPEAVNLGSSEDFKDVQTQMLSHCGYTMKNRFALLDIYPKATEDTRIGDQVKVFWNQIGSEFLSYGAAYFPWLNTSVVGDRDLVGKMFTWTDNAYANRDTFSAVDPAFSSILETFCEKTDDSELSSFPTTEEDKQAFHQALYSSSPVYKKAIKDLLKKLNLLPPSAAMAGVFTRVDNSRGVWKAPANVSLNYVSSPTEDIDDDQQADLNAPMNGKAINVIRTFRGEGVKVWGARTLDGNSLDWRYVNVRRTLLFLEESVKNAARAYVFEPNDAGTWINMKCMIENFLRSVWKRGGLAGATPEDAYEVHVGLGDTMTGEDILEGIMRITVLVAISHPAEFIEITFQQQIQKS